MNTTKLLDISWKKNSLIFLFDVFDFLISYWYLFLSLNICMVLYLPTVGLSAFLSNIFWNRTFYFYTASGISSLSSSCSVHPSSSSSESSLSSSSRSSSLSFISSISSSSFKTSISPSSISCVESSFNSESSSISGTLSPSSSFSSSNVLLNLWDYL